MRLWQDMGLCSQETEPEPNNTKQHHKSTRIVPIIEDARHPHKYRMLVPMVDTIFADVAQPDQARIVAINAQHYLKNGGHFIISIKANCKWAFFLSPSVQSSSFFPFLHYTDMLFSFFCHIQALIALLQLKLCLPVKSRNCNKRASSHRNRSHWSHLSVTMQWLLEPTGLASPLPKQLQKSNTDLWNLLFSSLKTLPHQPIHFFDKFKVVKS